MKAQSSLEYMIILAVILAISSIVVLYLSGMMGTQTSAVSISWCKQTAEKCKLSRMTSPSDPCSNCIDACLDKNKVLPDCFGKTYYGGITTGAITCCQKGMADNISAGSTGCGKTVIHMSTGWTTFDVPDDWESTTSMDLCTKYNPKILVFAYTDLSGRYQAYVCGDGLYGNLNICPGLQDLWVWSYQAFDMVN